MQNKKNGEILEEQKSNTFKLPIVKKAYELYESVQELFKNVSKNDRHTVWATMHKEVLYVIHHIMKAAETTSPTTKKKALEKVQIQLASLRIPLIFCAKTKIMNMQKYKAFDETIDELRRMAYGWNRSIRP